MKTLIKLYLHSISDIITNSSSEIFCTITTPDSEVEDSIINMLSFFINSDQDGEYRPYFETDDEDEEYCINIYMTYAAKDLSEAYKQFIINCLDTVINSANYEIIWR